MKETIRVLFIGDVVAQPGCEAVAKVLPNLKIKEKIDFVIANAENSANGNGVSKESAMSLFSCGCDVLTGGNHSFRQRSVFELFKNYVNVLRPYNLSKKCSGRGYYIFNMENFSIAVVNLIGQVFLTANSSPFDEIDVLLNKISTKLIIIDFHAEATGEKGALAHYIDGRVSAIFGTHTHVQTNDARILSKGTGFMTDVGMVGPINDSVLGVSSSCVVRKMVTQLPTKFEVKPGPCVFNGAIVELNLMTGLCESIKAINYFINE